MSKYHRLRVEREQIGAKAAVYEALLEGSEGRSDLEAKHDLLMAEHALVSARMSRVNHELAWAAARWALDEALALGAGVIYVEGLGPLETPKLRRVQNARVSAQVRSAIFFAMRHLGKEHGTAVVEVPARGTSSTWPRCNRALRHVRAPDNPASGYHWATCQHCGLSMDRDFSAAWRIGARGLASQDKTYCRPDGALAISRASASDAPVSVARQALWDQRHAPQSSVNTISHPVPRRRRVTSSAVPMGAVDKRPAERVPEAHSQAPCASNASSIKRVRHRPRGEPLGRGFHLNVYASPVPPYGDWGGHRSGPPSLRIAQLFLRR